MDIDRLKQIAKALNIDVTDYKLLEKSLTHRSYLGESCGCESNERLEFLGDSVIGIVVAEYLYSAYPDRAEGELAKAKAVAVSEPELAEAAEKLGLAEYIVMSSGEQNSGGRDRPSILSDAFEAVVAVVYLDCGLDAARKFVLKSLAPMLDKIDRKEHICDYKTLLQEYIQGIHKKTPHYNVISETGADHDKTFVVEVMLEDIVLGKGEGKSKKQAEQSAAKKALDANYCGG